LKQQINGLPDKVASKQLNSQVEELKKQIDTLPDRITSKEQITLEKDRLVLEKDRVNAQNAIYSTLIQAVGGVFFFVTAYFTWRNVKAAEEKQVTERFSKAIEQLGNDHIPVRLGGIYALERIANDSDKDYWQVIEVLTAYIREKSPYPPIIKNEGVVIYKPNGKPVEEQKKDIPPVPTDIQAVLTVLTRRRYAFGKGEKYRLDLKRTNLQGAFLVEANLQRANLEEANLEGASLGGANLQEANLEEANLEDANLVGANLQEANLREANLQGAFLVEANLQGAFLWEANLQRAYLGEMNLQGASLAGANLQEAGLGGANLEGAYLGGANLEGASLGGANLEDADLGKANLEGARLWEANLQGAGLKKAILKDVFYLDSVVGLTREQINEINQEKSNIYEAMLPDYLRTPESSQTQPPDPQQT
jgi:uncharacterized protein YjbI with pentapeptide repeats